MRRPEQAFQIALCKLLKAALPSDAFYFAVPNAGKRGVVDAAMQKRAGLIGGVPDLCIVWQGKAHFLELKTKMTGLTEKQRECCLNLRIAGAKVAVARTVDEALDHLRAFGIPLRVKADIRFNKGEP